MNVTLLEISVFVDVIQDLKMKFILDLGRALNPMTGILLRYRKEFKTQGDTGKQRDATEERGRGWSNISVVCSWKGKGRAGVMGQVRRITGAESWVPGCGLQALA